MTLPDLKDEILHSHFCWSAAVELECDNPFSCSNWIVKINTFLAVDEGLDVIAVGDDFIAVPLARFDVLLAGLFPDQAAAVFFV